MAQTQQISSTKLRDYLNNTSQGRSVVVGGMTILMILIVILVGVIPAVGSTLEQNSENSRRQETLTALELKEQKLAALIVQEREKQNAIGYFNTRFPEFADEGEVVRLIDKLGNRNNILITGINFSNIESSRKLSEVLNVSEKVQARYLSITAEGSVENIQNFTSELESRRRIFNVRNLNIQQQEVRTVGEQNNPNRFILSLRAEVYYWDQTVEELTR